jgi:murein DD-endopeptidase MepM/ murein hydrolase activator NlpD
VSDLDAAVNAALLEGRAKFDTEEQARKEAEAAAQAKAQAEAEEQARKDAEEKAATAAAEAKAKAAQEKADAADAEEKKKQGSFVAPVPGSPHGSYGNSGSLWSHGHTGEDFSASTGTSVRAITAGTVVSTGWGGAYGNEVVIKHADGKYSQYGHLSSISVSTGQQVGAGAQIALSGATGNVTGPHLHFEIRTTPNYGSDVNPVAYLRAHGVNV